MKSIVFDLGVSVVILGIGVCIFAWTLNPPKKLRSDKEVL